MMKNIKIYKNLFIFLISFLFVFAFSSCTNDSGYKETRIVGDLLEVGKPLPTISVETNKGDTFDSSKTDKPIVINCFTTW